MEFVLGVFGLCYIISPLLVWGLVHWHWRRVGKDPVLERTTIIPQYEPFHNLPPAVIGVVVDARAHDYDITATLLDLAARKYLRIENRSNVTEHFGGKVHYYRTVDYRLVLLRPNYDTDERLLPYERELLKFVFSSSTEVALQQAVQQLARKIKILRASLYNAAVTAGLFTQPAQLWRERYYTASHWLLGIGSVTGIFGIGIPVLLYGVVFAATADGWHSARLQAWRRCSGVKGLNYFCIMPNGIGRNV